MKSLSTIKPVLTLFAVVLLVAGCGSGDSAESYEAAAEPPAPQELSAEVMQAKLAAADLADGEEDHVVAKCPGCALAMAGNAEYAMQLEGYELHFCSDSCKGHFAEDVTAGLMALDLSSGDTD